MQKSILLAICMCIIVLTHAQRLVREECIGNTTNEAIISTHENADSTTSIIYEIYDNDPDVLINLRYRLIKLDKDKNTLYNSAIDSLIPYLPLNSSYLTFDNDGGFFVIFYFRPEDTTGTIYDSKMRGMKFDKEGQFLWEVDSIPDSGTIYDYFIENKPDGGYSIYTYKSDQTESDVLSISNTGSILWRTQISKSGLLPEDPNNMHSNLTLLPLSNKNTFFSVYVAHRYSWSITNDSAALVYGLLDSSGNLIKSDTLIDTEEMQYQPIYNYSSSNSIVRFHYNRSNFNNMIRVVINPNDLSYTRTDNVGYNDILMLSYKGRYDDTSHIFRIPYPLDDSILRCYDIHFNLLWEYNTGIASNEIYKTVIASNNSIYLNNELIENGIKKWTSQAVFNDTIYYNDRFWSLGTDEVNGTNSQLSYDRNDIYHFTSYNETSCSNCKTIHLIQVLDMQTGAVKERMIIDAKPEYSFYKSYYDRGKFFIACNENTYCNLGQGDIYLGYFSNSFNNIKGIAYIDNNTNNMMDAGDIQFGDGYAVVQKEDNIQSQHLNTLYPFNFFTDTGAYTAKLHLYNDYYTVSTEQQITSHPDYYNTDTLYFALHPVQGKNDIGVNMFNNWMTRLGQNNRYTVSIQNYGTTTVNGKLKLLLDSRLLNITTNPNYSSSHGDTIIWSITDFLPNQTFSATIDFTAEIPPVLNGGDTIVSKGWLESDSIDLTPSDNVAEVSEAIRASYDPNEKSILSGNIMTPSQISNGESISYIIHFQNYGNDTAFRVVVLDTLSTNVDVSSLQIVGASHAYALDIINEHILKFTFSNIRLPYDTLDISSTGYISYKVKPKSGLSLGSNIDNTAYIFFDYNQPVLTNTVRTNIILLSAAKTNKAYDGKLKLFPNPNRGKFSVQLDSKTNNAIELEIINLNGEVLNREKRIHHASTLFDLDLSHLPKGIYWIKLNDGTSTYGSAVLVQ